MDLGPWSENHDVAELCRLTKELDMAGVDWVTTYGVDPREVRSIMDDHGLPTICYTFFADITSPDAAGRKAGIDEVKRGFDIAEILGSDKIMLPVQERHGQSREDSRRSAIESLKEIVRIGDDRGIAVTLEHFSDPKGPFVTGADINVALEQIPGLKVTFDNGNAMTGGESPEETFALNKDAIAFIHFKDWTKHEPVEGEMVWLDGKNYKPALIGEGIIDYPTLLAAMRAAGYGGYVNIEYEGNKYTPDVAIRKALDYLRSL